MAIINEKTNYLLEVKSKYTYRIYVNGNDEMSIEAQLTKDFRAVSLRNYALATMSKEDFDKRMSAEKINDLFLWLRKNISEYGEHFTLATAYYGFIKE